jgi:hypothetical protein
MAVFMFGRAAGANFRYSDPALRHQIHGFIEKMPAL